MKKINFGKIVGEDGLDYTIKGCVDNLAMLPSTPNNLTRYYVGGEIPRNVMMYDGSKWVNEGTKTYKTPNASSNLNVYKFHLSINEETVYADAQLFGGHRFIMPLILDGFENYGVPIKAFGSLKYKAIYADRETDGIISNFSTDMSALDSDGTVIFTGTASASYNMPPETMEGVMLLFMNEILEWQPGELCNSVVWFMSAQPAGNPIKYLIQSLDLTVIYTKS